MFADQPWFHTSISDTEHWCLQPRLQQQLSKHSGTTSTKPSVLLKGRLLCPFLQDVLLVSGVPRMYLWSFSSKYPTVNLL